MVKEKSKAPWRAKKKEKRASLPSKDKFKEWYRSKKDVKSKLQDVKLTNAAESRAPPSGRGKGKGRSGRSAASTPKGSSKGYARYLPEDSAEQSGSQTARGGGRTTGRGRGRGGRSGGAAASRLRASASGLKVPEDDYSGLAGGAGMLNRLLASQERLLSDLQTRGGKGGDLPGMRGTKSSSPVGNLLWMTEDDRKEQVRLNKKISQCAMEKDLAGAKSTLQDLESRGWANAHTYSTAVNALCRCGDWRGAEAALARGEAAKIFGKRASIASGVIARTAMIRGYCECARDLSKAEALLEVMEQEKAVAAKPNARTANTFLRGCLRIGAVKKAEELLERMENEWSADDAWREEQGGSPDASSYEMVIALMCQALRFEDAGELADVCLDRLGCSPGSGAMFVSIARAAAIRGEFKFANMAIKRGKTLIQEEAQQARGGGVTFDGSDGSMGSGGKRGKEKEHAVENEARARSLEIFQGHRRKELLSELTEIEEFVKKKKTVDLGTLWGRTIILNDASSKELSAEILCQRLCECLGLQEGSEAMKSTRESLENAVRQQQGGSSSSTAMPKGKGRGRIRKLLEAGEAEESATKRSRTSLDLGALFANSGQVKPVHLEICSGSGEWLATQAYNRIVEANWVACEIHFDRAARCFQRFALQGLSSTESRAGLIAGDAKEVLQHWLAPFSCARLFVNHPEPPTQTDLSKVSSEPDKEDSEVPHLLTPSFLHACAEVLRPGGTLTICTDSVPYALWLLRTLSSPAFETVFEDNLKGTIADKVGKMSEMNEISLRTVAPPVKACGAQYSGKAGASYFQRLKSSERHSRGKDNSRCFLCLKRR